MEDGTELLDTQNQEAEEQEESEESEESESSEEAESDKGESEDADYKALYEKEKQAHEKEKTMRQGMVKKLQALTSPKKSQPKVQAPVQPSADTDRLDKLELRQIDDKLTADEIKEILLTKKTRGLSDAVEAYNLPMVQSWLKDTRANAEKKEKIDKAIPKTQGGGASSSPARQTIGKEWYKGMGSNLQDVASILEKEILGS